MAAGTRDGDQHVTDRPGFDHGPSEKYGTIPTTARPDEEITLLEERVATAAASVGTPK